MVCSIAIASAWFVACSSDDGNTGGGASDAAADTAAAADGTIAEQDGSHANDAGSVADAGSVNDAGNAIDASAGIDGSDDAGSDDAGDDGGLDASDIDSSFDGSPPGDAGVDPTFTNVYNVIINGTCTGCHGAVAPSGNLNMSTQAAAYSHLVNVNSAGPACGVKAEPRVLPNDHAGSLIWNKINGTQNCGSRMPLGGGALSQEKIDLMAEWIDNGALDN